MNQVILRKTAAKEFKKLPKVEKGKITKKLYLLAADPLSGKYLQGEYKGLLSLRAWPYRIIYEVRKGSVLIYSILHRQTSYKK